jgi:myo-inositol 2-dehydrogenase/D-chiro-inositol 1-dehydrogenase
MKKIKIAVLGGGRIGKIHIENIIRYVPQASIVYIADIFADQLVDWANRMGITNLTKDPEKAINDPSIDAVFICSPTDTHSKYIIIAAKAGKDIFCEKPVDLDITKIKEAIDVVKKSKVKFQIGFNRRFDHNFKRVHDIVKEGKIGEINLIKITSWDPEPPSLEYSKACGGIFLDMTIHDFDMARFIIGSEVIEIFANAAVRIDPNIGKVCADYDTAITSLKFENGAIGVIDNCRKASYGYDQRLEVLGSKGAVSILNDTPSTAILSTGEGICYEKPYHFFLKRYSNAYIEEVKEFFNAIEENRQPSVGIIDGLKAIEIGVAALKSAREKRVVKIKEII